ncbi:MAG: tetratricopeptide repeat protein, partial [Candidatus Limnocylindria bacterium]
MLLHRRIAEVLVETDPDQVEAIGYHFGEAGVPDRSATFLYRAGLRAEELSAYATARQHLLAARVAALEAKWLPELLYDVLAHLEGVLNVLGRRDEQHEVIEEMTALADLRTDLLGDLDRRRSWLLAHTGDFAGAEQAARRSVGVEADRGDRSGVAASLVALGTGLRWSGRPLAAVPHLEAATAAAVEDPVGRAVALTELSSTLVEVQRSAEALPYLDEARVIFRESDDRRGEAEVAGIRARALRHLGDSDRAVAVYEEAIELCRSIGYRHGEGLSLVNLSALHHLRGDVAAALSGYDRAAQVFGDLGNKRGEAMVLANAASARHTLLGDDDRAHADAERALRH